MARWRQSVNVGSAQGDNQAALSRRGCNPFGGKRAQDIIDWVAATSDMRDLKSAQITALKWAKIFCKEMAPKELSEVIPAARLVCRETLRTARVRVDMTAMVLFRLYFLQLELMDLFVWTAGAMY